MKDDPATPGGFARSSAAVDLFLAHLLFADRQALPTRLLGSPCRIDAHELRVGYRGMMSQPKALTFPLLLEGSPLEAFVLVGAAGKSLLRALQSGVGAELSAIPDAAARLMAFFSRLLALPEDHARRNLGLAPAWTVGAPLAKRSEDFDTTGQPALCLELEIRFLEPLDCAGFAIWFSGAGFRALMAQLLGQGPGPECSVAEVLSWLHELPERYHQRALRERLSLSSLLNALDAPELQRLMSVMLGRKVESATIALAAAGYGDEMLERVLAALPPRAASQARETLAREGPAGVRAQSGDCRERLARALTEALEAGALRFDALAPIAAFVRENLRFEQETRLALRPLKDDLARLDEDWQWRELADRCDWECLAWALADQDARVIEALAGRYSPRRRADFDAEIERARRRPDSDRALRERIRLQAELDALQRHLLAAPDIEDFSALIAAGGAKAAHACLSAHGDERLASALAPVEAEALKSWVALLRPEKRDAIQVRLIARARSEGEMRYARALMAHTLRRHDPDGRVAAGYREHRALVDAGAFDDAQALLRDLFLAAPSFADLATLWQDFAALRDADALAAERPDDPARTEALARLLFRGRYHGRLEAAIDRAQEAHPQAPAHRYRGLLCLVRRQWAAAHREFRAALDLDAGAVGAEEGVIEVFSREGKAATALNLGRRFLEKGRKLGVLGRSAMIRAAIVTGDTAHARSLADALVARTAEDRFRRACALACLGECRATYAALDELLERHPDYRARVLHEPDFAPFPTELLLPTP